jgi:hypothetical protein
MRPPSPQHTGQDFPFPLKEKKRPWCFTAASIVRDGKVKQRKSGEAANVASFNNDVSFDF